MSRGCWNRPSRGIPVKLVECVGISTALSRCETLDRAAVDGKRVLPEDSYGRVLWSRMQDTSVIPAYHTWSLVFRKSKVIQPRAHGQASRVQRVSQLWTASRHQCGTSSVASVAATRPALSIWLLSLLNVSSVDWLFIIYNFEAKAMFMRFTITWRARHCPRMANPQF